MIESRGEIRIVTVSREYGAGGGVLARGVAERLGWKVIDRALIEQVAEHLGAPLPAIEGLDEHVGGILERIGLVFSRGGAEQMFPPGLPDPDTIAEIERSVIRTAAASPPVVIVGRGAQCLLAGRRDALHVRLVAPLDVRVARAAEGRGITAEKARADAHRADVERHRYTRHHFQREWDDPHLYDLQVNTGGIELDEAVELVLSIIARRAPGSA